MVPPPSGRAATTAGGVPLASPLSGADGLSSMSSSMASTSSGGSEASVPSSHPGPIGVKGAVEGQEHAALRRADSCPTYEWNRSTSAGSGSSYDDKECHIRKDSLCVDNIPALWNQPPLERPGCDSPSHSSPSIPRQCNRRMWQPDAQAKVCSIQTCTTEFPKSSFIPGFSSAQSRRHHCRQCGRVVCSECSKGTKYMLPAENKSGPAKLVRVCNACLHGAETFLFRSNPYQGNSALFHMLQHRSMSPLKKRTNRRGSDVMSNEMAAALGECTLKTSLSAPSLMAIEHKTSTQLLNEASNRSQYDPSRPLSSMMSLRGPGSQLSCADTPEDDHGRTREERGLVDEQAVCDAFRAQDEAARKAAPDPKEDMDERLKALEKELEASSYYQGLKLHEPKALKALTMALGGFA